MNLVSRTRCSAKRCLASGIVTDSEFEAIRGLQRTISWCAAPGKRTGGGLIPAAMEIRQRRWSPDVIHAGLPGLRPLRRILVPRPRLEIAEFFIDHLIEFAEELDDLIVRIAMISGDVVPGAVAQRPPDDWDFLLSEQIA